MIYVVTEFGGSYEEAYDRIVFITKDKDKAIQVRDEHDAKHILDYDKAIEIYEEYCGSDDVNEDIHNAMDILHAEYGGTVVDEISLDQYPCKSQEIKRFRLRSLECK